MGRCPHRTVQQFTELCLDCGRNVYESDQEYYEYLLQQKRAQTQNQLSDRIQKLELELGIKHPGNRDLDDWYPNKYPDM